MQNYFLLSCYFILAQSGFSQTPAEYDNLIFKADSLYEAKEYKASAFGYSDAFRSLEWKGLPNDRYNAACSWALAGFADSAFFNLERIATKSNYKNYNHITNDSDLNSLHGDKRWQLLLDIVKSNKEKTEANLNIPLANELDSILSEDQKYRKMTGDVESKFGRGSREMRELWKTINEKDSLNLIKVRAILDKYGWLGADVVGDAGNSALFLVLQHADLETQEHYLPMMKEAVTNGNAKASSLALLVDRVEMRNNRPQIYGSQITMKDGKYELYQIIDEVNVNKRRAEVGLQPLELYVKNWNIDYILPAK